MSKLLHAYAKTRAPSLAALMTAERGYDPQRHFTPSDLHRDGVIPKTAADFLDWCADQESSAGDKQAAALKSDDRSKHNDDSFIQALFGKDDGVDGDDTDADDADVQAEEKEIEKALA